MTTDALRAQGSDGDDVTVAVGGPRRRTFTAEEYHRMGAAGILRSDERLELLDGEIYVMAPVGDRHVEAVNLCTETLFRLLAGRARVSVQNPVRLDARQEPQPDLVVFRREAKGAPRPDSVLLLIEVADSSLEADRGSRLARYAWFRIPEYWVIDLVNERIEVYRQPDGDHYREGTVYKRGERVALLAFPDVAFLVDEVLP